MIRTPRILPLALAALLSACVENSAPGNDRESSLDPPSPPAEVSTASAALAGVGMHLLVPETMTDPDLRNLPAAGERGERCLFRFTRVGLPVFAYGPDTGVVKLNGKLVPLPARGEGAYMDGGVRVTLRPLSDEEGEGPFPAELVLRLPGEPNELGFRGFSEC